jgi:hypothetical protein
MLQKLPMALFGRLKVKKLTAEEAIVTIPFSYRTQNPFESVYFAAQAMAAELSTGLLAINTIQASKRKISMLVFDMNAHFSKKARSKITFTCSDGIKIIEAIEKSIETGEGVTVNVNSVGIDEDGDEVSRFTYVWTFKVKSK